VTAELYALHKHCEDITKNYQESMSASKYEEVTAFLGSKKKEAMQVDDGAVNDSPDQVGVITFALVFAIITCRDFAAKHSRFLSSFVPYLTPRPGV
jgi:hypothetical protein